MENFCFKPTFSFALVVYLQKVIKYEKISNKNFAIELNFSLIGLIYVVPIRGSKTFRKLYQSKMYCASQQDAIYNCNDTKCIGLQCILTKKVTSRPESVKNKTGASIYI